MSDEASVQPTVPDTAMMSGSDEGEPGERLADPPLTSEDVEVLDALRHADPPVVDAREDTAAAARAASDDSVLPTDGATTGADPLDPVFREPSG